MNPKYVLDSSAWVEYLIGSPKGHLVKGIIEGEPISCSVIMLAELADTFAGEQQPFETHLAFIKTKSLLLIVDEKTALLASQVKRTFRPKKPTFSLADGIHLATAILQHATLVTCDSDFEGGDNVLFLK